MRWNVLAVVVSSGLSIWLGCAPTEVGTSAAGDDASLPVIDLVEKPAFPLPAHLESADIAAGAHSFDELLEAGGKLFHAPFNGLDGVGSHKLPDGSTVNRFGVPGGDGPGAQACGSCHAFPVRAAAGLASGDVTADPDQDGKPPFNVRSVTSVFGNGILQRLAEEMTDELQGQASLIAAAAQASPGESVRTELSAKGVAFGELAVAAADDGSLSWDYSGLEGLDPDLVIRPLGWKGNLPSERTFTVGASNGALGMQADELVWKNPASEENPDLDDDGVGRELSVGDITAMTIYGAAQETPTELGRLVELGLVAAPSAEQADLIETGRTRFAELGCAVCHRPEMKLDSTVFEEPTARGGGNFYMHGLAERDPAYDPAKPFTFDLATQTQEPRLEADPDGGATVRLYGDLKRHAMGRVLADPGGPTAAITPELEPAQVDGKIVLIPPDQFLTAELWGVGNTGPWLHDARAGTLREAILLHGEDAPPAAGEPGRSEAQESRDAFVALDGDGQAAVIAFLRSLVTFSVQDS